MSERNLGPVTLELGRNTSARFNVDAASKVRHSYGGSVRSFTEIRIRDASATHICVEGLYSTEYPAFRVYLTADDAFRLQTVLATILAAHEERKGKS